jgi:hypothetical protein
MIEDVENWVPDFTIGMACYDNFDEVFFTVQALRLFNPELIDRFEILVVDNNPTSKEGKAVKALMEGRTRPQGRYIPWDEVKGSVPPRGEMIRQARGKFVICIDSHVFLCPADPTVGASRSCLQTLVNFFDENPESDDFLQGPLVSNYGPHRLEGTHMIPQWRGGMFGRWGVDDRGKIPDGEPFEIPEHGLGLFALRKASWLGFNPGFSGFSGGEGYIHQKYRQAGRRCLCLPGARWMHKFSRPNGIPHRPTVEDKIRNHIIGWTELGVDLETGKTDDPIASISTHFVGGGRIGAKTFARLAADAGVEGYVVKNETPKGKGCVIGPASWGSYQMRGKPIAQRFGFDQYNSRAKVDTGDRRYEDCLAVKCDVPPILRRTAKRIFFDPLDKWFGSAREASLSPAQWLANEHGRNKFTDLIAATIPMREAAKRGLRGVRVHLVPHHADERVGQDWYDPDGPIVYAGMSKFIEPVLRTVRQACKIIGKEFVYNTDHHAWKALEGASLILAPRAGLRTKLNLMCKPTVKIANAAQAGVPVLATDDPAITTLYQDVRTAPVELWGDAVKLAHLMSQALDDPSPAFKTPYEDWLKRMAEVMR